MSVLYDSYDEPEIEQWHGTSKNEPKLLNNQHPSNHTDKENNIPSLSLQMKNSDDDTMESSRTEYNKSSARNIKRKTTPLPYSKRQSVASEMSIEETPVKPLYAESAEDFARNTSTPEAALSEPENLTDEQQSEYNVLISTFGEYLVRCLVSKKWQHRQDAVNTMDSKYSLLPKNRKKSIRPFLESWCNALVILLGDTVPQVYLGSLDLLHSFFDKNIVSCNHQETIQIFLDNLAFMSDKIFAKLNDQNSRLAKSSMATLLQLCKLQQTLSVITPQLFAPLPKSVHSKAILNRLELFYLLIQLVGISMQKQDNKALQADQVLFFAMQHTSSKVEKVRKSCAQLISMIQELIGEDQTQRIMQMLTQSKSATNNASSSQQAPDAKLSISESDTPLVQQIQQLFPQHYNQLLQIFSSKWQNKVSCLQLWGQVVKEHPALLQQSTSFLLLLQIIIRICENETNPQVYMEGLQLLYVLYSTPVSNPFVYSKSAKDSQLIQLYVQLIQCVLLRTIETNTKSCYKSQQTLLFLCTGKMMPVLSSTDENEQSEVSPVITHPYLLSLVCHLITQVSDEEMKSRSKILLSKCQMMLTIVHKFGFKTNLLFPLPPATSKEPEAWKHFYSELAMNRTYSDSLSLEQVMQFVTFALSNPDSQVRRIACSICVQVYKHVGSLIRSFLRKIAKEKPNLAQDLKNMLTKARQDEEGEQKLALLIPSMQEETTTSSTTWGSVPLATRSIKQTILQKVEQDEQQQQQASESVVRSKAKSRFIFH